MIAVVGVFSAALVFSSEKQSQIRYDQEVEGRYQFYGANIPEGLNFAGELVPTRNLNAYQRFNQELRLCLRSDSYLRALFARCNYWFPRMKPIIKRYKLPKDFVYVPVVESLFENNHSKRGAGGYWQFMPETARRYKLRVDDQIDERFMPIKSTDAACRFIKEHKGIVDSWTNTLAAYNAGGGSISRSMNSQYKDNYYELKLNAETSRYIYRILAIKEVYENPAKYGLKTYSKLRYGPPASRKVRVTTDINDINKWAKAQKTTVEAIRSVNPWFVGRRLSVAKYGGSITLLVPKRFDAAPPALAIPDSLRPDSTSLISMDER